MSHSSNPNPARHVRKTCSGCISCCTCCFLLLWLTANQVMSEPFIKHTIRKALRKADIAKRKISVNTSCGDGHYVLWRQHHCPHMMMNCCVITCGQVNRATEKSAHGSRFSRLGSRTSCGCVRVTRLKQSTVHVVMVLTERTGLLIAMGEVSYSFIQDRSLWRSYKVRHLPK